MDETRSERHWQAEGKCRRVLLLMAQGHVLQHYLKHKVPSKTPTLPCLRTVCILTMLQMQRHKGSSIHSQGIVNPFYRWLSRLQKKLSCFFRGVKASICAQSHLKTLVIVHQGTSAAMCRPHVMPHASCKASSMLQSRLVAAPTSIPTLSP